MHLRKFIYILPILAAIISLAAILRVTYAVNVTIEGNAAGSSNQVNVDQTNQTNVNQNNSADVASDVDVNCDTGGNSTSGTGGNANINTGNCAANVNIVTDVNKNKVNLSCPTCPSPTPGVSSIPTPTLGGPGGGPSAGGQGAGDGAGGAGAAGGVSGGPQVLAETGIAKSSLLFSTGFISLVLGLWQAQNALLKRAKQFLP